jgi:hypothetical protein
VKRKKVKKIPVHEAPRGSRLLSVNEAVERIRNGTHAEANMSVPENDDIMIAATRAGLVAWRLDLEYRLHMSTLVSAREIKKRFESGEILALAEAAAQERSAG